MRHRIALFGEAEKGLCQKPYILKTLPELIDYLGNPPPESEGLFFAIQALLFEREVIYFKVTEEGFSHDDYLAGLAYLRKEPKMDALCMPGVGDHELLNAFHPICEKHSGHLIVTQKDLYDYLTQKPFSD